MEGATDPSPTLGQTTPPPSLNVSQLKAGRVILVRAYYVGPQYAKDAYGRAARTARDHGTIKSDAHENDDGKWVVEIDWDSCEEGDDLAAKALVENLIKAHALVEGVV